MPMVNLKDGSLIVVVLHTPRREKIRLKFGGNSSALSFCNHLKNIPALR